MSDLNNTNVAMNIVHNLGFSLSNTTREDLVKLIKEKLIELQDYGENQKAILIANSVNDYLSKDKFQEQMLKNLIAIIKSYL